MKTLTIVSSNIYDMDVQSNAELHHKIRKNWAFDLIFLLR